MSEASKAKGIIVLIVVLFLALIFIPLLSGSNNPHDWLKDKYTHLYGSDPDDETVAFTSSDSLDETVNAILTGTDPDDTVMGTAPSAMYSEVDPATGQPLSAATSSGVFFKYGSEWIVSVTEDDDGDVLIELDEFDRGYNRHGGSTFLGRWGTSYGKGGSFFRGGGSGFGK